MNQQTAEGRKEMRLINWARKQVSDMADAGSKSIIDVSLAKSGAAFDSSSRAPLSTLIDTGATFDRSSSKMTKTGVGFLF